MDGILKAKEKGVLFGRKKKLNAAALATLYEQRRAGVKLEI